MKKMIKKEFSAVFKGEVGTHPFDQVTVGLDVFDFLVVVHAFTHED